MKIKNLDIKYINEKEVQLCKEWLQKFVKIKKNINKKYTAQNLKHCVEKSMGNILGGYISRESFIKASLDFGYKINKHGQLNADYSIAEKNIQESAIKTIN